MIVYSGWTEKKSSVLQKTVRKYLVLTWIHLYTFSSDDVHDFSTADSCIPVKAIVDIEALEYSFANVLRVDTAAQTIEYRFPAYQEAKLWFLSISDSRKKYFLTLGCSRTHVPVMEDDSGEADQFDRKENSITGLGIRSIVHSVGIKGVGMVAALGDIIAGPKDIQDQLDDILTERQVAAIYKMENVLLHQVSSNQTTGKLSGIGKHAMNAFFLRLNGNNEYRPDTRCDAADGGGAPGSKSGARRQHNEIAKLFGYGLALWFTSADASGKINSVDGDDHEAKMNLLLGNILESVLVREFQKSCNFSCSSNSDSKNTILTYNTPFRGDHAESLIISNYVKVITQLSGFLSPLLTPILLTVSSSPALFINSHVPTEEPSTSAASAGADAHIAATSLLLFEKLRQIQAENFRQLPPSLILLMRLVRRLTIGKHDLDLSTSTGVVPKEKPERGVYHATACALLFLRLICPSIIAPLEWGVLHSSWDGRVVRPLSLPSSASYDALEDIDTNDCNYCGVGSSAIFIIVLAHVLNGTVNDNAGAEGSSENIHDHLLFDIWSGANEDLLPLISAIEAVTSEIPFSKAMDLFAMIKGSISAREILNIDTSTANLFDAAAPSTPPDSEQGLGREHKQQIRKALIAVAKHVQKIANQTCVGDGEDVEGLDREGVSFSADHVAPLEILVDFFDSIGIASCSQA